MTNEELKFITAANLINLRKAKGVTQATLGEALSYSDKTISKWERGEAIPDVYVLLQIADYFGVDLEYLITSHDEWEPVKTQQEIMEEMYNSDAIIAVTLVGTMTAFIIGFVISWICGYCQWKILLAGATATAICYLVLDIIFNSGKNIRLALIMLLCTIFIFIYFIFEQHKPWQIFIVLVPAIAIVVIATKIRREASPIRREVK